jgi:chromosomal replication initiator protein
MNLWEAILARIEAKVNRHSFYTWFKPTTSIVEHANAITVRVPNPLFIDWLTKHYDGVIREAMMDLDKNGLTVNFVAESVGDSTTAQVASDEPIVVDLSEPTAFEPSPGPAGLNPRYTFDTFIVGSSNQFAHAACRAVAEAPARSYNPLFIYGGVGLGKTHLLHAVGHQSNRLFPGMAVVYLSSERFTNELINAIRYDRTAEFRARYRTIDLLLIDDIQFISGKERTQEEFFHTFNDLYESRKQIIVSSDCSPKEIPEIEERLRSRFEWGLIADIQPPDFETRVAILKKKAALERVRLTDDVAYLIASRIKSNIRELEGSLTRMIAFCALTGREMTVDLAQEVLGELWGEEEKLITIDQIQRKVCDFFGIRLSDLKAKTRTKAIAFPRQIAMYLARQLTHASLSEVGRAFGGKDHTTVLHAVDKVQTLLQEDPKLRKTIDGLIQGITL